MKIVTTPIFSVSHGVRSFGGHADSVIIDLDSTKDPAHGKQEGVAYNGHFAKNCFHPLFCLTSEGHCLGGMLRRGNVHSADGYLEFVKPLVQCFRPLFKLFWLRADAAFANPETYEYWEEERITLIKRLIKVGPESLITPGGGMSMWPPVFLWLIIIEHRWPGVLKLHRSEVSGFRGAGMPKFLEKPSVRLVG